MLPGEREQHVLRMPDRSEQPAEQGLARHLDRGLQQQQSKLDGAGRSVAGETQGILLDGVCLPVRRQDEHVRLPGNGRFDGQHHVQRDLLPGKVV